MYAFVLVAGLLLGVLTGCEKSPTERMRAGTPVPVEVAAATSEQSSSSATQTPVTTTPELTTGEGSGHPPAESNEGTKTTLWSNSATACMQKTDFPTLAACVMAAHDQALVLAQTELGGECTGTDHGNPVYGLVTDYLTAASCCTGQLVTCQAK